MILLVFLDRIAKMYGVNPAGTRRRNRRRCDIMSPHERQYDIISACFAH